MWTLRGHPGPPRVADDPAYPHGERDDLIHPEEARSLYESLGTPHKRLVWVPGRGHNDVAFSPVYWSALADFVRGLSV